MEEKMKNKIGFLFGAGAEIAYGLPSGGRFALDIFKMDPTPEKEKFREMLKNVDSRSAYASKWLPNDYQTKSISTFGKQQYEQLIVSSLENKRTKIIAFLNNFDCYASRIKTEFTNKEIDVDKNLELLSGKKIGEVFFNKDIQLNKVLSDEIKLFDSKYFSILLEILVNKKNKSSEVENIRNVIKSFIELLVGAVGEDFLHNLNDTIFEKKPDDIDIFDDFCGFFSFEYNHISGLEIVLSNNDDTCTKESSPIEIVECFSKKLLEEIFAQSLDYQSLIDSYYNYLFKPYSEWAKFCKICIFLMTVRDYIIKDRDIYIAKIKSNDGYYKDLMKISDSIHTIGTSNYNKFIEEFISKQNIHYLNGSVDDYYDPYKNKILTEDEAKNSKHICVPLLFTQSGIKPLTSVVMSRRYVNYFDELSDCSVILVLGYGCNSDDGHINGLLREIIEEKKKKVILFSFDNSTIDDYISKLRIDNSNLLEVQKISTNRKIKNDSIYWYEDLLSTSAGAHTK